MSKNTERLKINRETVCVILMQDLGMQRIV